MRHKTKEVPPYKHTFRVFNKATKEYSQDFEELFDAIVYVLGNQKFRHLYYWRVQHQLSYVMRYEPPVYLYGYYSKQPPIAAPLNVIVNDLGEVVTKEEVRDAFTYTPSAGYRGSRRKYDNDVKARLLRIKGAPDKIKQSCEHVPYHSNYGDGYTSKVIGSYCHPGSMKEKRDTEGHINEYGPKMVRGRRKPIHLRDSYDDKPISVWKTINSWKHHSKRRKQWVAE